VLIRVSVDGSHGNVDESSSALTSLFRWLRQDGTLGAELRLVSREDPEAQGGAFDLINVLLNDGVGVGGLVLSYATWRQAHRSKAKVRFERDGVTVEMEDASPETLRRIAEALSDGSAAESAEADPSADQ
jgi:hypothetical protein